MNIILGIYDDLLCLNLRRQKGPILALGMLLEIRQSSIIWVEFGPFTEYVTLV
jgi:hypothetical protein